MSKLKIIISVLCCEHLNQTIASVYLQFRLHKLFKWNNV